MRAGVLCVVTVLGCATPRGAVWGQVLMNDVPAANCEVVLSHPEGDQVLHTARADAEGRYRLEGLPPGNYLVEARFPGGARGAPVPESRARVEVRPAGGDPAFLRLVRPETGAPLGGFVRDQFDRPVATVAVCADAARSAHRECVETSADGRFTFVWLPLGAYALSTSGPWSRGVEAGPGPVVDAGAGEVTVRVRYLGRVTGRVVDEEGRPVEVFSVGSWNFTGGHFELDTTSARSLEVNAPGFVTAFVGRPAADVYGDVHVPPITLVRAARVSSNEAPSRSSSTASVVRGRVVDARTGKPVPDAEVLLPSTLERIRSRRWSGCGTCELAFRKSLPKEVKTDDEGVFEFLLPWGQRALMVVASGYFDARLDVRLGAPLVVALNPGGVLEGRLLDPEGKGVPRQTIALSCARGWTETDPEGRFRFGALKTGSCRLTVMGVKVPPTWQWRARVDVTEGQTTRLELRPAAAGARLELTNCRVDGMRLFEGDLALPDENASAEALLRYLDEGHRFALFRRAQFDGVQAGLHTVVSWRLDDERLFLSRQLVKVAGDATIQCAPAEERSWPVTEQLLENLDSDMSLD